MKKFFLSLVIVATAMGIPLPVFAQSETAQTQTEQRVSVDFTEARGQIIQNRCTALREKTSQISNTVNSSRTRSANLAGGLKTKLGEFADKAESAGLDVSQLRADLAEMDTLANNLSASWQNFIDAMGNISQSASCQSDDLNAESIHTAIEEAKDAKAEVRQSLHTLIEFVKTTVKDDLANIRQQMVELSQEAS